MSNTISKLRIGHGYDVHRFTEGDHIILGGVAIPHSRALLAHSDGDVLLHALVDALLGAAGLGDIGQHFPDTDEQYRNCSSRLLLKSVYKQLVDARYSVVNLDCTLIAQAPKMAPHLPAMIQNISADLAMSADQINLKATTTERLGYIGREEGIAVHAVVLLERE